MKRRKLKTEQVAKAVELDFSVRGALITAIEANIQGKQYRDFVAAARALLRALDEQAGPHIANWYDGARQTMRPFASRPRR